MDFSEGRWTLQCPCRLSCLCTLLVAPHEGQPQSSFCETGFVAQQSKVQLRVLKTERHIILKLILLNKQIHQSFLNMDVRQFLFSKDKSVYSVSRHIKCDSSVQLKMNQKTRSVVWMVHPSILMSSSSLKVSTGRCSSFYNHLHVV